jgi:hypothetical protein
MLFDLYSSAGIVKINVCYDNLVCSLGGENEKHIQTFGGETSWKMTTCKT